MPSVIGVDLGGTKVLAGVVTEGLAVREWVRREVEAAPGAAVAEAVAELRRRAPDAAAVGLGLAALVDPASGEILYSNHWADEELVAPLDLPTVVENDANCAAVAEWRAGAARGCSDVVSLSLGTGVGGGLVLDGRLYHGAHGLGAELGHIVVDADGPTCFGACPGRGCLEAVASGSALARLGGERLGREVSSEDVAGLALAGDAEALAAVGELARGLGAGLAGLVHAFDPQMVVVGGGVMALGETLLAPAREEMRSRLQPPYRARVRVVAAAFGDQAAMIGAALLAADAVGAQL